MALITATFGLAFIVLGISGYLVVDRASWTALIPAMYGGVLLGLALLTGRSRTQRFALLTTRVVAVGGFLSVARMGAAALEALVAESVTDRIAVMTIHFRIAMTLLALAFALIVVASVLMPRGEKAPG